MNINDLLHTFHTSRLRTPLPENVLHAMRSNNTNCVEFFLNAEADLISNPNFLQCFVENFTPQLAATLEQYGLDYMTLLQIGKTTEICLDLWTAFLQHKTCDDKALFQWGLDGWYPSATAAYQTNVTRLLPFCFESDSRNQKDFLKRTVSLFPRWGVSDRGEHALWDEQQWRLLEMFTADQWRECFDEVVNSAYVVDKMMCSPYSNALGNLHEIFQVLPQCAAGLQQHYDKVSFTLNDLKQWAASSDGLQASPMYKKLPKVYQIDFLHDIEEIYVGGNSNIGAEQQHLMGLTAIDLFLRRFVRFENEDLADLLSNTYSNFEMVFSNQCHLSALHALVEHPKNLLQLHEKYGDDLARCLYDGVCFEHLCGADVNTLDQIFTRFPQIGQWTDVKGNTFAHWYVVHRIINEDTAKLFYDHDLLFKPNLFGFVVRDIVAKDVEDKIADPHILSVLDRYALMAQVGEKVSPSQKRKI